MIIYYKDKCDEGEEPLQQAVREDAPWLEARFGEQKVVYRPGAARKTGRVPHVTAGAEWRNCCAILNQGGTVFNAPLTFCQGRFLFLGGK